MADKRVLTPPSPHPLRLLTLQSPILINIHPRKRLQPLRNSGIHIPLRKQPFTPGRVSGSTLAALTSITGTGRTITITTPRSATGSPRTTPILNHKPNRKQRPPQKPIHQSHNPSIT
ncbi:MAG: hypothetical protein WCE98_08865 [Chlorobium sp.]